MTAVNFATEAVFEIDAAGRCWAMAGFGDALWAEMLETFSSVRVVARTRHVETPTFAIPVTDPRVSLLELPFYQGPRQFLHVLPAMVARLRAIARTDGSFLLRLPGPVGTLTSEALRRRGRPYAVQLVGDPHDVLGGGGLGRLAGMLRGPVVAATRRAVWSAALVGYVTSSTLQRRYPAHNPASGIGVSDINLTDDWFGRERDAPADQPRLFLCGSLAQRYKGADLMLDAMALMRDRGMVVKATIAGDGRYRAELEEQAARLGLADATIFLGTVTPAVIREHLDQADLFVMPSRTEGMPRALIEAMAKGLPAIGSDVGGITELLDDDYRFAREDVVSFAAIAIRLLKDRDEYARQSARNLALAWRFAASELAPRRQAFYRAVRGLEQRR